MRRVDWSEIEWAETDGAPHLLIPQSMHRLWNGITCWNPNSPDLTKSDYDRACTVRSWADTVVSVEGVPTVIFSSEASPMSYIEVDGCPYFFALQTIEDDVFVRRDDILRLAAEYVGEETYACSFRLTDTDHILVDAAASEADIPNDGVSVAMRPGQYDLFAFQTSSDAMSVIVWRATPAKVGSARVRPD